jgi:hypothetical protein
MFAFCLSLITVAHGVSKWFFCSPTRVNINAFQVRLTLEFRFTVLGAKAGLLKEPKDIILTFMSPHGPSSRCKWLADILLKRQLPSLVENSVCLNSIAEN